MMRVLIMSCPRSGTTYIYRALRAAGLDVGHECIGPDGGVGWQYAVDDAYNQQAGRRDSHDFSVRLHQVRHPLPTIGSMVTHESVVLRWVSKFIPTVDISLRGRMRFWLCWNELCETQAEWTYQAERVAEGGRQWRGLISRLGLEDKPAPDIPTDTNHRDHPDVTWADLEACDPLLASQIRDAARRYGYSSPPPHSATA